MLAQDEGAAEFRALGYQGNLNQNLVNKHFVQIDHR